MPTPEKANSVMLVLATMTAPPARRRRITRASAAAGLPPLGQDFGAGARDFAGDVEHILDGHDHAIERPERNAGAGARIGGVRGGAGGLAIDSEAGVRALAAQIIDASKRSVEAVAGVIGLHAARYSPARHCPRKRHRPYSCGAGYAVVPSRLAPGTFLAPALCEGTERRAAHPYQSTPCGAGTRGDGCAPLGAPSRLFCPRGRSFRTRTGAEPGPDPAGFRPPSSAPRPAH